MCDWACVLFGITSVPLFDSLGTKSIVYILKQTNLQTIACSKECLLIILKEIDLGMLKNFICFDAIDLETKKEIERKNYKYYYFPDLIEIGKKHRFPIKTNVQNDDIFTLVYTSGTTGIPKGSIISHGNLLAGISTYLGLGYIITKNDRYLSYLPVAHLYERLLLWGGAAFGFKMGFYSGNIQQIKEDIFDMKPTIFCSAPRF